MKASKFYSFLSTLAVLLLVTAVTASAAPKKILFFTKSSGFEHSVISWKNGQPSFAEKVLLELGQKNGWEFTFSKDGSKFSPEYLAQFDAVFFYTTGDLCSEGTDKQPPMTPAGKQALFDYVRAGKGFIGTHAADDTFHTANESKKGPDRYLNHGEQADPYVRFIGGEFIIHGAQQVATNTVTDPSFPGFEKVGPSFAFNEEWYSLKDFAPDVHVLTVIDAPHMKGAMYQRPPYPTTWARQEGSGRVWYTAMGHREDIWTNPVFQEILVGGIKWALGEAPADVTPNIQTTAPGAYTNPLYVEPKAAAAVAPNTLTAQEKADGWQLLWDGKTSDGWRSAKSEDFPTHGWIIKNGVLTVHENGGEESAGGGDIITRQRYANFELTTDFKTTPGCNSGIKIFVQPNISPIDKKTGQLTAVGSAIGLEFQILDDLRHPDAKLGRDGDRTIGSLYDLIPAPKDKIVMPVGEWNHARIVSQGKHVEFWLNGQKTVTFERGSAAFLDAVAKSKFKDIPDFGEWADGHILLQEHGSEVSFRNVKIRQLPVP
jgi:type 1 glutamine amidotransferase